MLSTDREHFSEIMINCFQNFRAAISTSFINEWFYELSEFDLGHVKKAFRSYVRENERFPPTLAAIINLSKKFKVEEAIKIQDENPTRCCVENCNKKSDTSWKEYNFCKLHYEDFIVDNFPDTPEAEIITYLRKSTNIEESKESFKRNFPKYYELITGQREPQRSKTIERILS